MVSQSPWLLTNLGDVIMLPEFTFPQNKLVAHAELASVRNTNKEHMVPVDGTFMA
jgi:hypothetical protein